MKELKILLVEDNEDDAILEMNILREGGYKVEYKRVETLDAVSKEMATSEWDCIVTDYALGDFNGLDVIEVYKKNGLDIPFIMISGTVGEEVAVKAMKAGIHDRKNGTQFPVEVRLGSCKINNEYFIVALVRDITDIKQAESRILRLNRLYSTLSYINQTLVKVREKIPLFQEICKVVVEHGGFRMAWIGVYDEQKRTVTPITHAGHESGYLKKYNLLDLEKEAKNGPIALSIREGHSIICQNIETDNRVLPWREEALKRGYKSVSTIPLRCNGKIMCVLLVYSSEPNIFGEEYEKLFDEIGEDISFALDSIKR